MADEQNRIFVEPPIPATTEFTDVATVRGVINELDRGSLLRPALLWERMLMNPRLRAVLETRVGGLMATPIKFEPSAQNRDARRAAREIEEDWNRIAPAPMRRQMVKWFLGLGVGIGQRVADTAPSGRHLLSLRPYWPGFAYWYWAEKCYRVQTFDAGMTKTPAPSVPWRVIESSAYGSTFGDLPSFEKTPWIVAEPYGVNSYREGLIHAAWRPWLGHDWAMRDQARASEKHGLGILKVNMPKGTGDEFKAANERFIAALQGGLGSEGVIPCQEMSDGLKQDATPLEFNGSGFQAIADNMNSCAVAMAILFLGHNLTTEIKGGSYAAAGVADFIRDDKKYEDAANEWAYVGPQLLAPYCELNYGDPSLVPVAVYQTDAPAINKTAAETLALMGKAIADLRTYAPRTDVDALLDRFRVPLLAEGTTQVPIVTPASVKPDAPKTEPAEPEDEAA